MTTSHVRRVARGHVIAVSAAVLVIAQTVSAFAAKAPEIRTHPANPVPVCVTPSRLMAFLKSRNGRLDPRFNDIATHYKTYGEAWRVRWDYAFFQMAIETNFLTYRAPSGRMGDVDPRQNNFAGIGTTGGGVPGDSFPDVKTGVHAQIQHLVVYSGERLAAPIAPRTQLKQDDILRDSLKLERTVRFGDLARRWAVDPAYDKSIEWVADSYRKRYCAGRQAEAPAVDATPAALTEAPAQHLASVAKPAARQGNPAVRTIWVRSEPGKPLPATSAPVQAPAPKTAAATKSQDRLQSEAAMVPTATKPAPAPATEAATAQATPPETVAPARPAFDPVKTPPAGLGAAGLACSIGTASYGGTKTVLIKAEDGDKVRYTALTVLSGFERSLTEGFIKARAPGGETIGEFDDQAAALEKAKELCPGRSE